MTSRSLGLTIRKTSHSQPLISGVTPLRLKKLTGLVIQILRERSYLIFIDTPILRVYITLWNEKRMTIGIISQLATT